MLNFTERIHIVNNYDNESSFISDISNGKTNEESFFVCNIGRIIEQFHLWQTYLPRVYPHYGKFSFFFNCTIVVFISSKICQMALYTMGHHL